MEQQEFSVLLKDRGFPDPVLVKYPANGSLDQHSHPFEVLGLVIDGAMTFIIDGIQTEYRVGDVFHLSHKQQHAERYGPYGVKYLAGRKRL